MRSRLCHTCRRRHHLKCVKLTGAVSEQLGRWTCPTCLRGGNNTDPVNNLTDDELSARLHHLVANWKKNIRVLARVPKGARVQAAEALTKLLDDVSDNNNITSWARLFGFSFSALRNPTRTPQSGQAKTSLATKIRAQINSYMDGNSLPDTVVNSNHRQGPRANSDESLGRRVASKLADFDIKGAVRIIASDNTFAGYGEDVTAALREKHPPSPENLNLPPAPDATTPPLHATQEQVMGGLKSFPTSSASGPDGLRPAHLLSLIGREAGVYGERLQAALTRVCNLVISGQVPVVVQPIFYGASLCALAKKDGGIRPIAVGNTLRRLATKVVLRPYTREIRDHLEPYQLGVGTPAGCEAAHRATRLYMETASTPKVLLKVDLKNAFNTIRRDKILTAAREHLPDAYHLLHQAYGEKSFLFHGESLIESATGLQQGDPAGPALFALTIDEVVKSMTSELNLWFLDDGTLGDGVDKVIDNLDLMTHLFPEYGADLNGSKCEVVPVGLSNEELQRAMELFRSRYPSIKFVTADQQHLLGSALTEEALPGLLAEKLTELKRLTSRLEHVDSHQAFTLLKSCFAIPKLQYILRTAQAYKFPQHLREIDDTIKSSLSNITNVAFSEEAWCQARLPVRHGGLGIRTAEDLAPSAHLASHHATEDLVARILHPIFPDLQLEPHEATRCWQERAPGAALPNDKTKQKNWDEAICSQIMQDLIDRADQVGRARLLAARAEGSGAWLQALPIPAVGTLMDNETLRIAVALRVGSPVCEPNSIKCRCRATIDQFGHHPLSCRFSAGRIPRHTALNDIIKRALLKAGLPSTLEPAGLDRGDGRRPDGMTLSPFKNGRGLVWDATCVDTFAATYLNQCALQAGHAANTAEHNKTTKYQALRDRYIFQPVAFETSGVLGCSTMTFLCDIGRKMTAESGDPREAAWLRQRVSIAVQRGNSASITASAKNA